MRFYFVLFGLFAVLGGLAPPCVAQDGEFSWLDHQSDQRAKMIERTIAMKNGEAPQDAWNWSGWAQSVSMAGREDLIDAAALPEEMRNRYDCRPGGDAAAMDDILAKAESHTLVIINEDHTKPVHRLFIRNLALRLRDLGFTHYAAETFSTSIVDGTGYPQLEEGFYTSEPMFARSVEALRRVGYQLVPYEARIDQFDINDPDPRRQVAAREEAQAQNLMDSVLTEQPAAKMIVHVGHGHGQELIITAPDFIPMMAARLKEKSGIDPLTIDLTMCGKTDGRAFLSADAFRKNGDRVPNFTDYLIAFGPQEFVRGRPSYRLAAGDAFVGVPASLRLEGAPVMIEARPLGAGLEQQPVERLVLDAGEELPLLLPEGAWSLTAFDASGEMTATAEITVP